jgi:hypothetical protein
MDSSMFEQWTGLLLFLSWFSYLVLLGLIDIMVGNRRRICPTKYVDPMTGSYHFFFFSFDVSGHMLQAN